MAGPLSYGGGRKRQTDGLQWVRVGWTAVSALKGRITHTPNPQFLEKPKERENFGMVMLLPLRSLPSTDD